MATKSQSHDELAVETGSSAATFDKIGRVLAANDFGQPGGRGGGKNTVHVETPYLRNLLLGSAAYLPIDAAAVVRDAIACDYFGSALMVEKITPGPVVTGEPVRVETPELGPESTLTSYMDDRLEVFAAEAPGTPQTMNGRHVDLKKSLIRVDFDPFRAQVEWRTEADAEGNRLLLIHYFVPRREIDARRHMAPKDAAQDLQRVRRSSVLPASLFFVAARLLADGRAKRGSGLPFSGTGGATSRASSENEKPPGLPGPGGSTRDLNQPRELKAGYYDDRKSKRVCDNYQALTQSRGHPQSMFHSMEPFRHEARNEIRP